MAIRIGDLQEYTPNYMDKTSLRFLFDLHHLDQNIADLQALQCTLLDFYQLQKAPQPLTSCLPSEMSLATSYVEEPSLRRS